MSASVFSGGSGWESPIERPVGGGVRNPSVDVSWGRVWYSLSSAPVSAVNDVSGGLRVTWEFVMVQYPGVPFSGVSSVHWGSFPSCSSLLTLRLVPLLFVSRIRCVSKLALVCKQVPRVGLFILKSCDVVRSCETLLSTLSIGSATASETRNLPFCSALARSATEFGSILQNWLVFGTKCSTMDALHYTDDNA